jgi:hypothetical protein
LKKKEIEVYHSEFKVIFSLIFRDHRKKMKSDGSWINKIIRFLFTLTNLADKMFHFQSMEIWEKITLSIYTPGLVSRHVTRSLEYLFVEKYPDYMYT